MAGEESIDTRAQNVLAILDKEEANGTGEDNQNTQGSANDPANPAGTELEGAIGEDQNSEDKPNDPNKPEQQANQPAAIEAPVSWSGDDKKAFESLPTWAQETISRRESEREAHFGERSRTLAARETELNNSQRAASEAQQRYLNELQRVNQIASQLLPAKFADIKSEADYLALKMSDPQRASEYEAFTTILTKANREAHAAQQAQTQRFLDDQYAQLQAKHPEFTDPVKANEIMTAVRKTAVDYYGYTPEEVSIIADHRHVQILRDAASWRQHQAALKAAQGKKVPLTLPNPKLQSNGSGPANIQSEQKKQILTKAKGATSDRDKAALLAQLL